MKLDMAFFKAAGKRGGDKTKEKFGPDHFKKIGKLGAMARKTNGQA